MIRYSLSGDTSLARKLLQKSKADYKQVEKKSLLEMRNRAVSSADPGSGGTPVDSAELRLSAGVSSDEMGYTKEYAPHVEYGHRLKNGGFVPGQYYLKANTAMQKPIFRKDALKKMKE